jgi:hypothetical protein
MVNGVSYPSLELQLVNHFQLNIKGFLINVNILMLTKKGFPSYWKQCLMFRSVIKALIS